MPLTFVEKEFLKKPLKSLNKNIMAKTSKSSETFRAVVGERCYKTLVHKAQSALYASQPRHVYRRNRYSDHAWGMYMGSNGEKSQGSLAYNIAITAILLVTVLFANFAEAIAEARGKAQADSLRKTRQDTPAKKFFLSEKCMWMR
jgi:hypothetical protein